MNLSREEQETIISYNQLDEDAHVFTYDRALMNRLDQISRKSPTVIMVSSGDGWREYVCPKKLVTVKTPRQLSEEQKQRMAERARQNFHTGKDGANE